MQHQFRVTGGYTGRAKSCKGVWVPTVSIHSQLSVLKLVYRGVGGHSAIERGSEREGKGNPRGEDPGIGGQQRK